MPKAKLKDVTLYYEVHGKGFPLLLIAGLGSDSSSWLGVIHKLSKNFQVIVFDNRGCGRSDITCRKYTIRQMAQDTIKLLDFLKIEQTHILGHSMGGYIAQELAINYPDRVDKLILESTAPVSSQRNNVLFEDFYNQLKKDGYCETWFKRWTEWLFSPRLIADSAFIDTFIKNSVKYSYLQKAEGLKGQIDAIASFDARYNISTIKAKTFIIEGKDDILVTPEEAEMLAKSIPKSIFQLLDRVAHSIHIENPKLFTGTVLGFFNPKK